MKIKINTGAKEHTFRNRKTQYEWSLNSWIMKDVLRKFRAMSKVIIRVCLECVELCGILHCRGLSRKQAEKRLGSAAWRSRKRCSRATLWQTASGSKSLKDACYIIDYIVLSITNGNRNQSGASEGEKCANQNSDECRFLFRIDPFSYHHYGSSVQHWGSGPPEDISYSSVYIPHTHAHTYTYTHLSLLSGHL